jgi:dienelactone hydrolase
VCFELDSDPPVARIAGAAVSHDDLVLGAADGNRFAAFEATPDEPNGIGVVILPDVRGLYRFYEELALRFAERGYLAIAIDWFGGTAGVGSGARSSSTRSTRRRRRRRESRPTSRLRSSTFARVRASHSFFDRRQEDYAEASDDAWRRVLDFLGRHS